MREFTADISIMGGEKPFGESGRQVKVKASTINGAVKKAKKHLRNKEDIYQITVENRKGAIIQVWDWFLGNLKHYSRKSKRKIGLKV